MAVRDVLRQPIRGYNTTIGHHEHTQQPAQLPGERDAVAVNVHLDRPQDTYSHTNSRRHTAHRRVATSRRRHSSRPSR